MLMDEQPRTIHLYVNGVASELCCTTRDTLLDVIRRQLALTGAKDACGSGGCGACSVMLNGELVCACLILAVEADGAQLETVEGLGRDGQLHPVQQALVDHGATQCGVCIPGIVMAARALLDVTDSPNETEVRAALAGNLCRCSGYDSIVRAILAASRT